MCAHVSMCSCVYLEVGQGSAVRKPLPSASDNQQHVLKSAHIQGSDRNLLVTDITKKE